MNFVPVGSLRDLVTYPHSAAEMRARGRTDADVREVLRWAHCSPEVRGVSTPEYPPQYPRGLLLTYPRVLTSFPRYPCMYR